MSVSKKFAVVLGCGLLFFPVSFVSPFLFAVLLVLYDGICLLLLLLDYRFTPKPVTLTVTREGGEHLFFKAVNTVSFSVRNKGDRPLLVKLKDDLPSLHFQPVSQEDMCHMVPPYEELHFTYQVLPQKRGSFLFKYIFGKYQSNWGLCYKYFTIKAPKDFKVYPNLMDLSKYRMMLNRNMLLERGKKRNRVRGTGTEFESLREYVEDDDYRKVNWMVTARENKLIVNQYEAEKNQPVFIMIDTGRPMSYSIRGYKKLAYAINAALILSDIVNYRGDQSGLLVFDTEVRSMVMPGKGEAHRNLLMETLYHIQDTKHTSDYETAFKKLIEKQKRRSLVFIFTDFETLVESQDLIHNISLLKKRHLPFIVLMKNESVLKIANNNSKNMRNVFRKTIAAQSLADRAHLIRTLNAVGILCVESEAERFAIDTVNQYLQIKNSRAAF